MDIKYKKTDTILDKICDGKIKEIKKRLKKVSLVDLQDRIKNDGYSKRSFLHKRSADELSLIAEIKISSPSNRGLKLRSDGLGVSEIAKIYDQAGASAISVITEEKFFLGKLSFLEEVRKNSSLPILRKDFIIDPYQIYEAKAYGADAILLIAGILENGQLENLFNLAGELDLDVLLEAHNQEELNKALAVKPKIIGINNRDLKSMELDLNNFINLSKFIPAGIIKIAESGINNRKDAEKMKIAGADAILVGTSLAKANDIKEKIKEFKEV